MGNMSRLMVYEPATSIIVSRNSLYSREKPPFPSEKEDWRTICYFTEYRPIDIMRLFEGFLTRQQIDHLA